MILIIAGLATRRRLRAALRTVPRDRDGSPDIRLVSPPDLSVPGWTHDPANPAADLTALDGGGGRAGAITAVLTALDAVYPADLPHVRAADRAFVAAEMTAFLRDWLATRDCPVLDTPTTLALGGPAGDRATWSAAAAALGVPDRQGTAVPWARTWTCTVAAGRVTCPDAPGTSDPPPGRLRESAATAVALTRAAGVTAARLTFGGTAGGEAVGSVPALCAAVPWWYGPDPHTLRALLAAAAAAGTAVTPAPARGHGTAARPGRAGRPRSGRPLVLLWGIPEDEPLRTVHDALKDRGTRTTLIEQDAALSVRLAPGPGGEPVLRLNGTRLPLADVTAAYPRPYPSLPESPGAPARAVARRHVLRLEHELWHWLATTPALVLNRPGPAAGNATKPAQSRVAADFGFLIPESLLTNDQTAARAFAVRHGQVIYKGAGGSRTVTGMLDPADAGRLARLATCPTYLQRYIAGSNVRVHVVGADVFAVEVDSDAVDYRRHVTGLRPVSLPPDVADACRALTAELGLRLAGIDLIRTPAGDWYFLEANTSPGFSFYPDRDAVAAAIAQLLSRGQSQARPSKSLTLDQAEAILKASEKSRLHAYSVLSLLTGARTEELRALRWCHVDLAGNPDANPPVPPSIAIWRSIRAGGDTKTRKSRRTLAMAQRCVDALSPLWHQRRCQHGAECDCLVFVSRTGTQLDRHNVLRCFGTVVAHTGLNAKDWAPRELRHSFVSLLSDDGVPLENIARLVGHRTTTVTETVYRQQLRPVIEGAWGSVDGGSRKWFPGQAISDRMAK